MANMVTTKAMSKKQTNFTFRVVFCLLLFLFLVTTGCGRKTPVESTDSTVVETESTTSLKNGQVVWNDKVYTYNDHLSNFLFMGVDKDELADTTVGKADAGQTDALFLLSWDRVTGDVTVVSIPRDTMTTINVFSRDGTDLGPVEQHISLAFGYGDGKHESCKLTKEAVSRLFYRIPIQGYCAVTLDALEEMSRILGPVTVTVPNDSLTERAPEMTEGAEIQIDEANIELFVRYRDTKVDNSALFRMERQNTFLKACYEKLQKNFQNNPGIVSDLYTALTPYMVTGIGNDQFVKIMEGISNGGTVTQWTVPGEGVTTDTFDEYHVDEDAFYEQILKSFFEEE